MLEDMLRMYVMDKPSKWEDYLHLVEFAYNNGYLIALGMSPFETLYGRGCKTIVSWNNSVERVVLGPKMLKEMEQEIVKIRHNLKSAQDKDKSYEYLKRTHKEFRVGDHVYMRVKLRKSSMNLGNCAKLETRYCGPFEVLDRIGLVTYRITLPTSMKSHNVFHVSFLNKYVHDPNHMIDWNVIQVEQGGVPSGSYVILNKKVTLL